MPTAEAIYESVAALSLELICLVRTNELSGTVIGSLANEAEEADTKARMAVTSPVHDRMPVILDPDAYDLWLDPGMKDVRAASDLLKPYDARQMRCYPVSTRINSVANDDEGCSVPVELVQIQNDLFS